MADNKIKNIHDDIWTVSDEFRDDMKIFFQDKKSVKKIAEIGSYKGYTTRFLSTVFEHVYAVDNNNNFFNENKEYNKDRNNISYVNLDIYRNNWNTLDKDIDCVFIDANHSYECCKMDIINSLNTFKNLKYIVFDDYGVWPGVKRSVDEYIGNGKLIFEKFIGLDKNVPGPSDLFYNVNEGVIVRVNN